MDRYAVFGNPIGHSKSPAIHRMFASETGQLLRYEARLSPLDGFGEAVRQFVEAAGCGFNVTVPFKEEAFELADELTSRAERAKAVNTIEVLESGKLRGDNTDGIGLIRDLSQNHSVSLSGHSVLLLGAGGAARGALGPLLEARPRCVYVANRTKQRARELVSEFSELGSVDGGGFDSLRGTEPFDVIINATSAGLSEAVPPIPLSSLRPGGACYDMVYGDHATPFQRWARAAGAAVALDGLGMLVEQAAEAFYVWRGVRPVTKQTIAAIRNEAFETF